MRKIHGNLTIEDLSLCVNTKEILDFDRHNFITRSINTTDKLLVLKESLDKRHIENKILGFDELSEFVQKIIDLIGVNTTKVHGHKHYATMLSDYGVVMCNHLDKLGKTKSF